MKQKQFKSLLFKRIIDPVEKDYSAIVKAELLFRIFELDEKKCTCIGCTENREKFYDYLKKIVEEEDKIFLKNSGWEH